MDLLFFDGMLRGAAGGLFLLLAYLFAGDWKNSLTARVGVMLTIGGACYLSLPVIPVHLEDSLWRVPLLVMSLSTPGLFWLLASSWFDDDFKLRPGHVVAIVICVAFGFAGNYYYRKTGMGNWPLAIGWRGSSLAFVLLSIFVSLRGRKDDLVESRRRLRLALSLAIAVVILGTVFSELPLRAWPPTLGWRMLNAAGMFALAATLAVALLGWRDPALLVPPPKPVAHVAPRIEADDTLLLTRLDTDMRHDRLYRQDGLTITAVAARLGVPEYRLRRAINQGLGARNFNAYLNGFRLQESEEALADPAQREVPILTIAMDAGFGSLAPFNRAFRDRHGCTPTEYRATKLF